MSEDVVQVYHYSASYLTDQHLLAMNLSLDVAQCSLENQMRI